MRRLIECVPNFSEGRDPHRVRALIAVMSGISGAWVLDCHSDSDHNRTVITIAGEPEAVVEAVLRAVGKAAELIDLRLHTGEHPRIGAADVVPFVPVEGVSMTECTLLAQRVGLDIWKRYAIPVYFYEFAANRPERTRLETLRKGQFEALRDGLRSTAEPPPDIGGPRLHPTAGAVAVGARNYLIAFNVLLNTPDLAVARKIARAIRASSGGLPCVKAMAVSLRRRGRAQVSMNLTDFRRTSVREAFDAVQREAARHGCGILASEIVGLVPRGAIARADLGALKLDRFSPHMILEDKMATVLAGNTRNRIIVESAAHAVSPLS